MLRQSFIFLFLFFFSINAARLGNYKINGITVSGISAGGAMANQLHVAFSSTITGSGTIAGPPYFCANGALMTATTSCMSLGTGINVANMQSKVSTYYSQSLIDNPANLRNHYVYLYSGTADFVVRNTVVKKGEDFFRNYMDASRIKGVFTYASAHGQITDFFGGACGISNTNYINNCNYNQAHDLLQHLHPNENIQMPTKGAASTGTFIEFDQTEFFPTGTATSISLDSTGYIYVPKQCETQECKLHIALHGCVQGKYKIGDVYVKNAGYNQVADLNNFIVLYPQAKNSLINNPNGCFDWWGYSDVNYANKNGKQMRAIKAMIDRIAFNQ